jgi:hypothetical protein
MVKEWAGQIVMVKTCFKEFKMEKMKSTLHEILKE